MNTNPVTKAPATGQTSGARADHQRRARVAAQGRAQGDQAAQGARAALLEQPLLRRPRRAPRAQAREHYGNQVFVAAQPIKNVARYQAITRGVDVEQSPTIVVVDSNLKAVTLVGYVDRDTIDQAVVDAIRASGGSLIKNPLLPPPRRHLHLRQQQIKALQQPSAAAAIPAYLVGVAGRLPWT